MLRTLFSVGLMAMAGAFLLKLVFGLFGGFIAIMVWLLFLALKILLIGAVIYFIIRLFSPSTAQKMNDSFSDSSSL